MYYRFFYWSQQDAYVATAYGNDDGRVHLCAGSQVEEGAAAMQHVRERATHRIRPGRRLFRHCDRRNVLPPNGGLQDTDHVEGAHHE